MISILSRDSNFWKTTTDFLNKLSLGISPKRGFCPGTKIKVRDLVKPSQNFGAPESGLGTPESRPHTKIRNIMIQNLFPQARTRCQKLKWKGISIEYTELHHRKFTIENFLSSLQ